MIDSGKTFNGKKVTYQIEANGYSMYLNGILWITQHAPYDRMFVANGTYEENAKAQIDELCDVGES